MQAKAARRSAKRKGGLTLSANELRLASLSVSLQAKTVGGVEKAAILDLGGRSLSAIFHPRTIRLPTFSP